MNSANRAPGGGTVSRILNWYLLIFKALIHVSRVGGTRSLAAAPDGPETRPLVSASAASIVSRSLLGSTFKAGDGPLNYVLQLPDVARPVVGLQQIQGLLLDRSVFLPARLAKRCTKIPDQDQNVAFPFSQRRHFEGKHTQPIEEILAESPIRTAAFKSRFVAATTRTSTWTGCPPPTRSNSRS